MSGHLFSISGFELLDLRGLITPPPQDCGKRLVKHARTFLTAPDQNVFLGVSLIFRHSHGLIYSHIQKKTEHHFSYKQDTWGGQTPAASRLIPSLALDADIHWYKPDQTKTELVVIIIYAEYKSRTHTHTPSLWQSCPSKPTGRWTRCVRAIHPSAIFKTCVRTHTPAITLCQKSPNCTTKPAFSALFFYSWSRNTHTHTSMSHLTVKDSHIKGWNKLLFVGKMGPCMIAPSWVCVRVTGGIQHSSEKPSLRKQRGSRIARARASTHAETHA